LYDGANLRTLYLENEMPIEEFISTIMKDIPVVGIDELNNKNETVSSYNVVSTEIPQVKTIKKKTQNKKKKKKGKFELFRGKGKKIKTKKGKSRVQSPAQTRSQDGGRGATTTRPGGGDGRTY